MPPRDHVTSLPPPPPGAGIQASEEPSGQGRGAGGAPCGGAPAPIHSEHPRGKGSGGSAPAELAVQASGSTGRAARGCSVERGRGRPHWAPSGRGPSTRAGGLGPRPPAPGQQRPGCAPGPRPPAPTHQRQLRSKVLTRSLRRRPLGLGRAPASLRLPGGRLAAGRPCSAAGPRARDGAESSDPGARPERSATPAPRDPAGAGPQGDAAAPALRAASLRAGPTSPPLRRRSPAQRRRSPGRGHTARPRPAGAGAPDASAAPPTRARIPELQLPLPFRARHPQLQRRPRTRTSAADDAIPSEPGAGAQRHLADTAAPGRPRVTLRARRVGGWTGRGPPARRPGAGRPGASCGRGRSGLRRMEGRGRARGKRPGGGRVRIQARAGCPPGPGGSPGPCGRRAPPNPLPGPRRSPRPASCRGRSGPAWGPRPPRWLPKDAQDPDAGAPARSPRAGRCGERVGPSAASPARCPPSAAAHLLPAPGPVSGLAPRFTPRARPPCSLPRFLAPSPQALPFPGSAVLPGARARARAPPSGSGLGLPAPRRCPPPPCKTLLFPISAPQASRQGPRWCPPAWQDPTYTAADPIPEGHGSSHPTPPWADLCPGPKTAGPGVPPSGRCEESLHWALAWDVGLRKVWTAQ
ncbi:basic proline-rich protein-like [Hippopotamus amphibius kiboko]|uniref:basic proline-rich protein-like n=1 Tax=Hippopotamus amphibius kiboko TaxID=575201 RepID=UPI00259203E7|nr:basic proline-rich protein-like [Hippopotamus amphibius kiboko]